VVLRAIATYNDQSLDISHADVQAPEERTSETREEVDGSEDVGSSKGELKNSGLLTPGSAERSPFPNSESEGRKYDAVGMGLPQSTRKHPIRMGSAFYAETPRVGVEAEEEGNAFEREFGRVDGEEDEEGLMGRKKGGVGGKSEDVDEKVDGKGGGGVSGGFEKWKKQMGRLFVPKWRRTVILMWIIWGSMSLGEYTYEMLALLLCRADLN
jgi:hypothetical protein